MPRLRSKKKTHRANRDGFFVIKKENSFNSTTPVCGGWWHYREF